MISFLFLIPFKTVVITKFTSSELNLIYARRKQSLITIGIHWHNFFWKNIVLLFKDRISKKNLIWQRLLYRKYVVSLPLASGCEGWMHTWFHFYFNTLHVTRRLNGNFQVEITNMPRNVSGTFSYEYSISQMPILLFFRYFYQESILK